MRFEDIAARKRQEVAARKPRNWRPPTHLAPSERSLEDVLRQPHTGFILECKKASPSRGLIRADFDPAAIARVYSETADAISVLTDETFFQGHLSFLSRVRSAVSVPVLCKDFVVDVFQVYEARQYGADAVLLMMRLLDAAAFSRCFAAARSLGMDALVEVHNEMEIDRAVRLGARIIGINNRDIESIRVDLATTQRLASRNPDDRVLVSESGIAHHRDVRRLRPQVDAFLVGSALMAQRDLRAAVNALVYGRVKLCGLTRAEDAQYAHAAGVTWGGLIFAPASPRCVSRTQAAQIAREVSLPLVGVFVDQPADFIASCVEELGLHAVQLHGREDASFVAPLRSRIGDGEIWKAVPVNGRPPALVSCADRVLFDAVQPGGGVAFDWSLLRGIDLSEHLLAGGLTPENADAAAGCGAFGLDVNSGVESAPGVKDVGALSRFMQALRGTGRALSPKTPGPENNEEIPG